MARPRKAPPKIASKTATTSNNNNNSKKTKENEPEAKVPEPKDSERLFDHITESAREVKQFKVPPKEVDSKLLIIIGVCLFCGGMNVYNAYTIFENDSYFSHLSNLEREMSFRTEMGLYYSYFKVLAHSPSLIEGLNQLISNNRTEYPSTINTLKRFNLYPELVIGIAYRIFDFTTSGLGLEVKNCFHVIRSDQRNAVKSCGGLGDPAVFYVTSVYLWNFVTGASLAAIAALLCDSLTGTIFACGLYFFNFNDCTRIQWTPPLRESFAYPALLFQIYLTSRMLCRKMDPFTSVLYVVVTTCALLCWQFSQFVFLTQIIALFVVFSLHNAIPWRVIHLISTMHFCAIFIAYGLLFMNDMLISSFYTAAVMSCIVVTKIKAVNQDKFSYFKIFTQLGSFAVLAITIKIFVGYFFSTEDASHIWSILKSKISDYRDFHTMLYTCAPEFDFLKEEYLKSISHTLLPAFLGTFALMAWRIIYNRIQVSPEVLYNSYQCAQFAVMALMFMRLKMFLTPHLCILSSLCLSPAYNTKKLSRRATAVALVAIIVFPGMMAFTNQSSAPGEYSNPMLEDLLTFIDDYAEMDESFAGPMPTMAGILLSTGRPVVNHPHYENAALRAKTLEVYTLLSRKSTREVHKRLKRVKANYVIIPRTWCRGKMRTGCSLVSIWDELDPANREKSQVCERLQKGQTEGLFESVFQNEEYTMLSVL